MTLYFGQARGKTGDRPVLAIPTVDGTTKRRVQLQECRKLDRRSRDMSVCRLTMPSRNGRQFRRRHQSPFPPKEVTLMHDDSSTAVVPAAATFFLRRGGAHVSATRNTERARDSRGVRRVRGKEARDYNVAVNPGHSGGCSSHIPQYLSSGVGTEVGGVFYVLVRGRPPPCFLPSTILLSVGQEREQRSINMWGRNGLTLNCEGGGNS